MNANDDPQHYLLRAADMRNRAEQAEAPATKDGLLRIAQDFELLAKRAEQRLAALARLAATTVEPAAPAHPAPAELAPAEVTI